MFPKKILIILILACAVEKPVAARSDILVGNITKTGAKYFAASVAIGAVHGAINNFLKKYAEELDKGSNGFDSVTFCGFHALERACNLAEVANLWGHGIGQCITESVDVKNRSVKFSCNTTLCLAAIAPIALFMGEVILQALKEQRVR